MVHDRHPGRHVFIIILFLEDADHDIHRDARLQDCQIAGRRGDVTPADAAMHARAVVIRNNFCLARQTAFSQNLNGSFSGNGGAHDAVKIFGMPADHCVDQLRLSRAAGVAIPRVQDFDRATRDGPAETCITGHDPTGTCGTREPGHLYGRSLVFLQTVQVTAGLVTHVPERYGRPGGNMRRRYAVYQIQHGNPFIGGLFDEVVEAIQRNGTDDQTVRFLFETILDLTALNPELVVTAGLVNRKADPETAGLVDKPVVDP